MANRRVYIKADGEIVATLNWDGSAVTVQSPWEPYRHSLEKVMATDEPRFLTPADGEAYLNAVLVRFSGSYCHAIEVPA